MLPVDQTNKKPCNMKGHHCALMTAALSEEKGAISTGVQLTTGKGFIAYKATKKAPIMVFNACPFCASKISAP